MRLFFPFRKHLDSLLQYIETGVKEGAKLVYGGKRVNRKGKIFIYYLDKNQTISSSLFGTYQSIS